VARKSLEPLRGGFPGRKLYLGDARCARGGSSVGLSLPRCGTSRFLTRLFSSHAAGQPGCLSSSSRLVSRFSKRDN